MELKPGTTIVETELSALLEVSRTPIREALLRLKEEQLVDIFPQRGTYVAKIDLSLVKEVTYMRHVLETDVLSALCRQKARVSDAVDQPLSLMQLALRKKDAVSYLMQDEAFHQALFSLHGHSTVWNILSSTRVHYVRVLVLDMLQPNSLEESYQEHLKIVEFIEAGQSAALLKILNRHHDAKMIRHESELKDLYRDYFV